MSTTFPTFEQKIGGFKSKISGERCNGERDCFLPLKTRKTLDLQGLEALMKHRLAPTRSTRYARMMRLLCKHEAKRTLTSPCAEGTLHRAKPCFILHAPKVRFIEKSTCRSKCFFLAPPTGLEPVTPLIKKVCSHARKLLQV